MTINRDSHNFSQLVSRIGPAARKMVTVPILLLTVACSSSDPLPCHLPNALPNDPTALHVEGRWLVDEQGRVVMLHGLNQLSKLEANGYRISDLGFGADDADYIASQGFNTMRTGLIHKGLAPTAGNYDSAYLDDIAATVNLLTDRGLYVLFDFHQDMFNERYQGEGLADWMVSDSSPGDPTNNPNCAAGFPGNMFSCQYLWESYDNFFGLNGTPPGMGPRGMTLREEYADAWRPVAAKLKDNPLVFGYDLFNEPHPGSSYQSCFAPTGCPGDQDAILTQFHQLVADAVRLEDSDTIIFYEPFSTNFNGSLPTNHGDLNAGEVGFSFHNYACPATVPGVPVPPGTGASDDCDAISEQRVFDNAEAQAGRYGHVPLLTEYGATEDLDTIKRLADLSDLNRVGWQYWAWWNEDPCCERPNEGLIDHPSNPPVAPHLHEDKLDILVRPFPRATAGTPTSWNWNAATKRFEFRYSTLSPNATGAMEGAVTEIWVPKRHFPAGYHVTELSGAKVISAANAESLRVMSCPGVSEVTLAVVPPTP